jgi:hypothetical protein
VARQLGRLVRGEIPDLLHWVNNYGPTGAVLVEQPDAIWDHRCTDAVKTSDGGWHLVLPLFTATESPSDLSAEVTVDSNGNATIRDVHVL